MNTKREDSIGGNQKPRQTLSCRIVIHAFATALRQRKTVVRLRTGSHWPARNRPPAPATENSPAAIAHSADRSASTASLSAPWRLAELPFPFPPLAGGPARRRSLDRRVLPSGCGPPPSWRRDLETQVLPSYFDRPKLSILGLGEYAK